MPEPKPPADAGLVIFDSEQKTHTLSRRKVRLESGRVYSLFLALPKRSMGPNGWPLLYALDGNAAFDALTPQLLSAVPGLAIAGIGYDTAARFDVVQRSLDYSPGNGPRPDPQRPGRMIGGAAAFLQSLCEPLRTEVETGLPIDPARRILWGHSMAGLFTLYALLERPNAFCAFAAGSPSLWWGERVLFDIEAQATPEPARAVDVLMMLGDAERRSSPDGPHWDGPSPHTLEMVGRLKTRDWFNVFTTVFPGAGHAQTLQASLSVAMLHAVGEPE